MRVELLRRSGRELGDDFDAVDVARQAGQQRGDVAAAGADTFVAGSAIYGTDDYKATIDAMRAELAKAD